MKEKLPRPSFIWPNHNDGLFIVLNATNEIQLTGVGIAHCLEVYTGDIVSSDFARTSFVGSSR